MNAQEYARLKHWVIEGGDRASADALLTEATRRGEEATQLHALVAAPPARWRWRALWARLEAWSGTLAAREALIAPLDVALRRWPDALREAPRGVLERDTVLARLARRFVLDARGGDDLEGALGALARDPEGTTPTQLIIRGDEQPWRRRFLRDVEAVAAHHDLTRFELSRGELSTKALDSLLSCPGFETLTHLGLSGARLTDEALGPLREHGAHFWGLTQLDLERNLLGAEAIAGLPLRHPWEALRVLMLTSPAPSGIAAEHPLVARWSAYCDATRQLDVCTLPWFWCEGAIPAEVARAPTARLLWVSDHQLRVDREEAEALDALGALSVEVLDHLSLRRWGPALSALAILERPLPAALVDRPEARRWFTRLLGAEREELRCQMVIALRRTPKRDWQRPIFFDLLHDPGGVISVNAASALRARGEAPPVEQCEQLLREAHPDHRASGLELLARFHGAREGIFGALLELIEAAASDPEMVREGTRWTLARSRRYEALPLGPCETYVVASRGLNAALRRGDTDALSVTWGRAQRRMLGRWRARTESRTSDALAHRCASIALDTLRVFTAVDALTPTVEWLSEWRLESPRSIEEIEEGQVVTIESSQRLTNALKRQLAWTILSLTRQEVRAGTSPRRGRRAILARLHRPAAAALGADLLRAQRARLLAGMAARARRLGLLVEERIE